MARLKPEQWEDIRAAWIGTDKGIRELAREYGLNEKSIRDRAEKEAWGPRNSNARKREIVAAKLAGMAKTPQNNPQENPQCGVRESLDSEADADVEVMRSAADLFKAIIKRADDMLPTVVEPKELNALADASRKAVDGYRRVRGLDEPTPPGAPAARPYSHMSDEELAREIREAENR